MLHILFFFFFFLSCPVKRNADLQAHKCRWNALFGEKICNSDQPIFWSGHRPYSLVIDLTFFSTADKLTALVTYLHLRLLLGLWRRIATPVGGSHCWLCAPLSSFSIMFLVLIFILTLFSLLLSPALQEVTGSQYKDRFLSTQYPFNYL